MRIRIGDTILADNICGITMHVDMNGNTEIIAHPMPVESSEARYVREHPEEVLAEKRAVIDRQDWPEEHKAHVRALCGVDR